MIHANQREKTLSGITTFDSKSQFISNEQQYTYRDIFQVL